MRQNRAERGMDSQGELATNAATKGHGDLTGPPRADGQFLPSGLSLDLEVSIKDRRIRALAGVRRDTGQSLTLPTKVDGLAQALARLDAFASDAACLGAWRPQFSGYRPAKDRCRHSYRGNLGPRSSWTLRRGWGWA